MAIKQDDIERVREANELVELVSETVVLRQRGAEFWGCCPFHNEKTPSFKVNPATQLWHCFGCGQGGDVFTYVMKRENLEFIEAVRYLAQRKGIEIQETSFQGRSSNRTRLVAVCEEAAAFFHQELMRVKSARHDEARAYLKARSLGNEIPKIWELGYAPGRGKLVAHLKAKGFTPEEMLDANVAVGSAGALKDRFFDRVMFPIRNELGQVIAFGGRIIGAGQPKYLNTKETPLFHKAKNLYALDVAKESIVAQSKVIVVEGYTDVIILHQAGFTNVVATLGTALTEQHVKLLARFAQEIIFIFDGDAAGQNAAERSLGFLQASDADFSCVVMPDGLDPADFITERGAQAMSELLDEAQSLVHFVVEKRLFAHDLSRVADRQRAMTDTLKSLVPLRGTLIADQYCEYIANILHADVAVVKQAFASLKETNLFAPRVSREDLRASGSSGASKAVSSDSSSSTTQQNAGVVIPQLDNQAIRGLADAQASQLEREIIGFIAYQPRAALTHQERIAQISWSHPAFETVAWALMASGESTDIKGRIEAARQAQKGAERLLSSIEIASSLETDDDRDPAVILAFLLDNLELNHLRQAMNDNKAILNNPAGIDEESYNRAFEQIASLQRQISALEANIRKQSQF